MNYWGFRLNVETKFQSWTESTKTSVLDICFRAEKIKREEVNFALSLLLPPPYFNKIFLKMFTMYSVSLNKSSYVFSFYWKLSLNLHYVGWQQNLLSVCFSGNSVTRFGILAIIPQISISLTPRLCRNIKLVIRNDVWW